MIYNIEEKQIIYENKTVNQIINQSSNDYSFQSKKEISNNLNNIFVEKELNEYEKKQKI